MDKIPSSDLSEYRIALEKLADEYRQKMSTIWPKVSFDAPTWEIKKLYGTKLLDVFFTPLISDFIDHDQHYVIAVRCLMAQRALDGKTTTYCAPLKSWRLLAQTSTPLHSLCRHDLVILEDKLVGRATPKSAATCLAHLRILGSMLEDISRLSGMPKIAWSPSIKNKETLNRLMAQNRANIDRGKTNEILDRKIEGLSDATNAMLANDPRLNNLDRSAIAAMNIFMCAPSRINEPLCLRHFDRFTIDNFIERPEQDTAGKIFPTHQALFMKGSKGADYSAKPILNFMIDLCDQCWNVLLKLGENSRRMLIHYESSPNTLYLPENLEHLRGQPISKVSLWKIINLTTDEPTSQHLSSITGSLWDTISQRSNPEKSLIFLIDNPYTHRVNGYKNHHKEIPAVPWNAVERHLLSRVQARMQAMRRISKTCHYLGKLSNMLMLIDTYHSAYLPQAWCSKAISYRFTDSAWRKAGNSEPSVFAKLGVNFVNDDTLVTCSLNTHDPRRWLTTKALEAKERLSDVLINLWANRINIGQLGAYDFRSPGSKAVQAEIPIPQELASISEGIKALDGLEKNYGLDVDISYVHGDSLAVTSLDAVLSATENRPVARDSNQIIVLYPTQFGICLHQHHEIPCRSYTGCSEGCNEQLIVKGHLPTNEQWRKQNELNNRSIINQLEKLIIARNREIADEPLTLDAHILTIMKGVDVKTMATELIERFHEIKNQVKDMSFRNELEAAFISRGIVSILDDPSVPAGALIKPHNPRKHASPGYERGIDERWGSRVEMESEQELFHQKYPELAPKLLGLQDERSLLDQGDEDTSDEQDS